MPEVPWTSDWLTGSVTADVTLWGAPAHLGCVADDGAETASDDVATESGDVATAWRPATLMTSADDDSGDHHSDDAGVPTTKMP